MEKRPTTEKEAFLSSRSGFLVSASSSFSLPSLLSLLALPQSLPKTQTCCHLLTACVTRFSYPVCLSLSPFPSWSTLLEIYRTGCGYCSQLAPQYDIAATKLRKVRPMILCHACLRQVAYGSLLFSLSFFLLCSSLLSLSLSHCVYLCGSSLSMSSLSFSISSFYISLTLTLCVSRSFCTLNVIVLLVLVCLQRSSVFCCLISSSASYGPGHTVSPHSTAPVPLFPPALADTLSVCDTHMRFLSPPTACPSGCRRRREEQRSRTPPREHLQL